MKVILRCGSFFKLLSAGKPHTFEGGPEINCYEFSFLCLKINKLGSCLECGGSSVMPLEAVGVGRDVFSDGGQCLPRYKYSVHVIISPPNNE